MFLHEHAQKFNKIKISLWGLWNYVVSVPLAGPGYDLLGLLGEWNYGGFLRWSHPVTHPHPSWIVFTHDIF
jgi:hypothetical protein